MEKGVNARRLLALLHEHDGKRISSQRGSNQKFLGFSLPISPPTPIPTLFLAVYSFVVVQIQFSTCIVAAVGPFLFWGTNGYFRCNFLVVAFCDFFCVHERGAFASGERDPDARMGYGVHFFCVSLKNQDVATCDVVCK